eukprot:scaffold306_cov525-Prasinococcus_capsulatus_cf.AAC.34
MSGFLVAVLAAASHLGATAGAKQRLVSLPRYNCCHGPIVALLALTRALGRRAWFWQASLIDGNLALSRERFGREGAPEAHMEPFLVGGRSPCCEGGRSCHRYAFEQRSQLACSIAVAVEAVTATQ